MKPIKTQIEELKREIEKLQICPYCDIKMGIFNYNQMTCKDCKRIYCYDVESLRELDGKLQTLKECKKMFDDYNEKLKERRNNPNFNSDMSTYEIIDKLSKEVLGE